MAVRPDDPRVVFVTVGDATPGRTGAIMRTTDAGRTWENLPLAGQPNSAMWTLTISRQNPDLMGEIELVIRQKALSGEIALPLDMGAETDGGGGVTALEEEA